MKAWQLVLFGVLFGLLAAGLILLISSPVRGTPLELPPPPTPAPIVVDVSGAVAQPGTYQLPAASRVEDAIEAAGGVEANAFTASLNLAAPLADGSKVLVPEMPAAGESPAANNAAASSSAASDSQTNYPININTATKEVLMELPGIGEVKAQSIIDYRTQNGPFTTIEEIQNVSGIGPATFENLKDLITIY
jgi:competence protein ComEA